MDEDKTQIAIHRGHQAAALLDNDVLKDTLQYMRQTCIDAWIATGNTAPWHEIKAIEKFEEHLQHIAANGRYADEQLAALVRRQKRA